VTSEEPVADLLASLCRSGGGSNGAHVHVGWNEFTST